MDFRHSWMQRSLRPLDVRQFRLESHKAIYVFGLIT